MSIGSAVTAASGQSYTEYVRDHILQPLGMTSTDTRDDQD